MTGVQTCALPIYEESLLDEETSGEEMLEDLSELPDLPSEEIALESEELSIEEEPVSEEIALESEEPGIEEEPVSEEIALESEELSIEEKQTEVEDSELPGMEESLAEDLMELDEAPLVEDEIEEIGEAELPPVEPSGEESFTEIPPNLKSELKSVLSYMDQLLEALPEDKIQEFARSEHFEVYKKLFEELELNV